MGKLINLAALVLFVLLMAGIALFAFLNYNAFLTALASGDLSVYLASEVAFLAVLIFVLLVVMLARQFRQGNESCSDVKAVLEVADGLLSKLPSEEIERFSRTKDFELYERVLKKFKVK